MKPRRKTNTEISKIECLIQLFPLYSEDLGIDLSTPSGRFRWFVASILFGARIGEQIAAKTYRCFEAAGVLDSPDKMLKAGWDRLVEILDAGGYARYDFSTATKLLEIMTVLQQKYGGLENLYRQASTGKDLEKRLLEFSGIGPTTAQIFLRELRGIWHLQPRAAEIAQAAARTLSIDLNQLEAGRLARVETALVKLYLRYCKKRKCNECPMEDFCNHKIRQ